MTAGGLDRDWNSVQFRFIFSLSFVFFLPAAVAARFRPNHRGAFAGRRSIVGEALERAGTTAQIAFYG